MLWPMMLTLLPPALAAMSSASLAARVSIDPDGGTLQVMTSMLFLDRASRIPRQYSMPGNF